MKWQSLQEENLLWQPNEMNEIKNRHAPYLVWLSNKMVPFYGSLHMSIWPLCHRKSLSFLQQINVATNTLLLSIVLYAGSHGRNVITDIKLL